MPDTVRVVVVVVTGPIGAVPGDAIVDGRAGTSAKGAIAPGTLAGGVEPSGDVVETVVPTGFTPVESRLFGITVEPVCIEDVAVLGMMVPGDDEPVVLVPMLPLVVTPRSVVVVVTPVGEVVLSEPVVAVPKLPVVLPEVFAADDDVPPVPTPELVEVPAEPAPDVALLPAPAPAPLPLWA